MSSFFIDNLEMKLSLIYKEIETGVFLSGLPSAVTNEGEVGVISNLKEQLFYTKQKRQKRCKNY